MRAYGITVLSENWGLYLREDDPDARMMPTFWYRDESDLSPDILREMNFRVFAHGFLKTLFYPLNLITGVFAPQS